MELNTALLKAGLISKDQIDQIQIHAINNNTNRSGQSASIRFFVYLQEEPLCSVKKIPINGIYNIDSVFYLQKSLQEGKFIKSPELFYVHSTDEYVFFVEQFVSGKSVHQLYLENALTSNELMKLLEKVFDDFFEANFGGSGIVQDEKEDWISIVKQLNWGADAKNRIIKDMGEVSMSEVPILTSGDLWLKNIIINDQEDKVYLVDYDLSHYTNYPWIEIMRMLHYAEHSNIFLDFEELGRFFPKDTNFNFLRILFLLNEIKLQSKILNPNYFKNVKDNLEKELNIAFENYYDFIPNLKELEEEFTGQEQKECITDYAQLYWSHDEQGGAFAEEESIRKPIQHGTSKYFFDLDASSIRVLRFDPYNHAAVIHVTSFCLKNTYGDILYTWQPNDVVFLGNDAGFWLDETVRIVALSEDPQIIVKIPAIEGSVTVEIEMSLSLQSDILIQELTELKDVKQALTLKSKEVSDLNSSLNGLYDQLTLLTRRKQDADEKLAEFIQQLDEHRELLQQKNVFIGMILSSTSWRWTRPLRWIGNESQLVLRQFKNMFRKLLGERNVSLIPLKEIKGDEDEWTSIGTDPQFNIAWKIRKGWIEITWSGCAEEETSLQLYYDLGEGMNENQLLNIGALSKGDETTIRRVVYLPAGITQLRLDPGDKSQRFIIRNIKIRPVNRVEMLIRPLYSFFKVYGANPSSIKLLLNKTKGIFKNEGWRGITNKVQFMTLVTNTDDYQLFLAKAQYSQDELLQLEKYMSNLSYKPLISVLVPVYNVDEEWLRRCIRSVQEQIYPNWELCLVDDCSPKSHIRKVLEEYAKADSRIKVHFRKENGHISRTSNDALKISSGEYIALLDHDDELTSDALLENVILINEHPKADIIYSDEDKISVDGTRHSPFFKPDWSPDTLMSQMYTCHLTVYRKELVEQVGGFRIGYEGSQDFDLMLRVSEKTSNIYHIPKVLYHWRSIPESTAAVNSSKSYTHEAGLNAVKDAIERRGISAFVEGVENIGNLYRVHYQPVGDPKVSIIIPSKNMTEVLDKCLVSIFEKTTYSNFELIIVDNGSTDVTTHQLYDAWKQREPERFKVHSYDIPFNYSKLNNFGAAQAEGELLLLLNNDVEVISANWLEEMAGQASRSEVGAVGACLYYPDQTYQHAGVVLGIGGVAGHSHKYFTSNQYGYFSRLKMVSNYSAVTAACLMIRKDVYQEVGGFEEKLQVAFNDVDFCLKVLEKGYYNVWLPQVELFHYESKSRGHENTPEKQARFNSEIRYMKGRWGDILARDPYYNPNLTNEREDFSLGKPFKKVH